MKSFCVLTFFVYCFIVLATSKIGAMLEYDDISYGVLKCIEEQGMVNGIYDVDRPVQQTINQDLYTIKNAGLGTDIIYVPCYGKNPLQEVKDFLSHVQKGLMDRIWLDIEQCSGQCCWSKTNPVKNVETLVQYAKIFISNKYKTGILTSRKDWYILTNNTQQLRGLPLFWITQQGLDVDKSFDKYQPFGGWQKPLAKFFLDEQICGTISLFSYEEE